MGIRRCSAGLSVLVTTLALSPMKYPCFFIALIALNWASCTTKRKEPTNLDYNHWWTMKPAQVEKLMKEKKGWRSISKPQMYPFELSYENGDTLINYLHNSPDSCLFLIDTNYGTPPMLSTPQGEQEARDKETWVDRANNVETRQRERSDGIVEESFRPAR